MRDRPRPATSRPPARPGPAPRGAPRPRRTRGDETASVAPEQARERILAVIRAIPAGQVMGYGEVAAQAGLPGRARLTARVLAGNADPGLPWHRVLRADGRIAMPDGSRGWREQCQRLRAEGVPVENGRVRRPPRDRSRQLDADLWGLR